MSYDAENTGLYASEMESVQLIENGFYRQR